jgi:quercetin dioxygenase-like cupin family protein
MKQKTNASILFVLFIGFAFIACDNEAKKDEPKKVEGFKIEFPEMPAYDAAMDPLKVEAAFLKLHKDTLGIKLYEVTLNPGDSVGMHTHPDHIVYVVQGGTLRLYSGDGKFQESAMPTGAAVVVPYLSHYGKNIGNTIIKLIVADIHRPRG